MATTALGDDPAHTVGELPAVGDKAPDFTLVDTDLKEFSLADIPGRKVLSIFPSIGTGVCQAALRAFNELASGLENTTVLNISVDLPFAVQGLLRGRGPRERQGRLGLALQLRRRLRRPPGSTASSRACSPARSWSSTRTAP